MADVEICRCQDSQEPLLNVTGYDLTSRVMFERIDIGPLGVLCNIGVLFHMSVIRRRDIFPWLNKITSINVSVDVPVSSVSRVGQCRVVVFTCDRVGAFHVWQVIPGCFIDAPCYNGVNVVHDELVDVAIDNELAVFSCVFSRAYDPMDLRILFLYSEDCYGWSDVTIDVDQYTLPSNENGCAYCSGICFYSDPRCYCGRPFRDPSTPPCFRFIMVNDELFNNVATQRFVRGLVGADGFEQDNRTISKNGWRRFCYNLWCHGYGDVIHCTLARYMLFCFEQDFQ
uniref:32K protein n=1 Tax=Beet soil-borne mosaic virus TaxID=76343 RepID=A0A1P8ST37_9VIRU|nr:32K protein [Beet soil-borne mosaic virus]WIW79806.1 p32 protein [Beet soil-borne mosaic virus]